MEETLPSPSPAKNAPWSLRRKLALAAACVLLGYFLIAYVIMPLGWRRYVHKHPSLEGVPGITYTKTGIPGDPINVSLQGTEEEVKAIMRAAKWYRADALGVRSDVHIAEATVFDRPYDDAPVSNLYYDKRKEDLAYEQPVGNDPKQRHHVRFWKTQKVDSTGRPIWVGSATYDRRVGLSHTTGEITHHIAADVDAERDHLFKTLKETQMLLEFYIEDHFHEKLEGRNGGGDPWRTDGDLYAGVIKADSAP